MIMDNIYTVYLVENEAKKYEVGTLLDPKGTKFEKFFFSFS